MPRGAPESVDFNEAARVWARVAALSFGGPAGQIAVMVPVGVGGTTTQREAAHGSGGDKQAFHFILLQD